MYRHIREVGFLPKEKEVYSFRDVILLLLRLAFVSVGYRVRYKVAFTTCKNTWLRDVLMLLFFVIIHVY